MWRNVTTTSLTLFSYMTSGLFQENWVRRLSEVTHMWHTAVNVWEALTGHFCAHKASHLKPICSRWNHRSVIEYHSEADGWSLVEVPGSGCRVMCQSAVSRSLIGCCFNCSPGSLEKFVRSRALGIASGYFTRRRFEMWITLLCLIYLMWLWCDCTKHLY